MSSQYKVTSVNHMNNKVVTFILHSYGKNQRYKTNDDEQIKKEFSKCKIAARKVWFSKSKPLEFFRKNSYREGNSMIKVEKHLGPESNPRMFPSHVLDESSWSN